MKKFLPLFTIAFVFYAIYVAHVSSDKNKLSDFALLNIEALSSGENGIETKFCFYELDYSDKSGWQIFCDTKTGTKIYPCLSESHGYYNESAKDRCVVE